MFFSKTPHRRQDGGDAHIQPFPSRQLFILGMSPPLLVKCAQVSTRPIDKIKFCTSAIALDALGAYID